MVYIYLHGFASSPQSAKARYLFDRFQELGLALITPDFNQGGFSTLTLSRQIQQVRSLLPPDHGPVTLIGSSFGGLTAAWVGDLCPQVERLVLLAPAFQFLEHWLPRLGREQLKRWRTDRTMPIYHYGEQSTLPLQYEFVSDLATYSDDQLQRSIPTLILHGVQDDVIPIESSREFAEHRPWVRLVELDSDHTLANVQPEIWQAIQAFCHLPTSLRA